MRFTRRTFLTALTALALTAPFQASAITILPPCTASGNCGVTDILIVLVNVAEWMLSIMGAVALFMFVLGGFFWVFSAGKQEMVKKGKETVKYAVIGIAIILLSGVIVRFTSNALTGGQSEIPIVGATCNGGKGLFISIPQGLNNLGEPVPETILCVTKDKDCAALNQILSKRRRKEQYECRDVTDEATRSCVRGLCISKGADTACCLKPLAEVGPAPETK